MPLAARICTALGAVFVSAAVSLQAQPSDVLVVSVSAMFFRSVSSGLTKSVARQEAAELWHDYGVELRWDETPADAALHLNVLVTSGQTEHLVVNSFSVLGRTELDPAGSVIGPIRINFAAIEELLERRSANSMTPSVPIRERELGRALGRVLAHEIGHVLLGVPSFHDSQGLMRASIPVDDLISVDRRCVQLTDASVNRLRVRVPCLGGSARDTCARVIEPASSNP